MVQSRCPVCSQEYIESKVEFCLNCSYLLTPCSPNLLLHLEIQKREEKRLFSAKNAWNKFYPAYSELQEKLKIANEKNLLLEEKLKIANEKNLLLEEKVEAANQPSLGNSLLQQCLQLLEYLKYIPEVLTTVQQIYKIQSLSKTSLTKTESENRVNEPDLSNKLDNLNNNDEVLNLVKNYNQQANFPDRIEVSETENSKSQRWSGGRKPAIFEINLTNRGEYWIINNQYLVPKPKQKINEHSYQTLSTFFECDNYEENAADNMTLVKPAQVSLIDGEEKWQLETTGSLKF